MNGFVQNIEGIAIKNEEFRRVLYTARNCQLVVMALKPKEEIGMEVHKLDQFFRVEEGACLIHATHLRIHPSGDRKASGIVLGRIDPQPGREPLQRSRHLRLASALNADGVHGGYIAVY